MKKIFLLVVLCSIYIGNVYAFTQNMDIKKSHYYVCNENDRYPIYIIKDDSNYYFINLSDKYNFDFRDYYQITYDNLPMSSKARYFTAFRDLFSEIPNYEEYYDSYVSVMIYRYLYDDYFYLCNENNERVTLDERYESNYKEIVSLIDGPVFGDHINLVPNTKIRLQDPHMRYYTINMPEGINYRRIDDETIEISGEKGEYEGSFLYGSGDVGQKAYTDDTNYLIKEGNYIYERFLLNISVDDPLLIIDNHSDYEMDYTSLCFNLINKNDEVVYFCSNEGGIASIKVPIGIYKLELLSNINNDYSNNDIALYEVEKTININWGDNVTPKEDDNIGFIPSDTLTFTGLITVLLTVCGTAFVFKKIN